jgi:tRNA nucleotidyltransferase (CCA-adding enzyme)
MKIYKVGGCVRDYIMGEKSNDIDYVVVGSSVEEMVSLGYENVGKSFPVFIGKDGNEYALARSEKKVSSGYVGFEFDIENITLDMDLSRRDLTINSMAMDEDGKIYDYFNGGHDIINKIFRHTSDAFEEDPVRVLRVARFAARFGYGWTVADETRDLIIKMGKKGVLHELQKDRVWKEMSRALLEPYPNLFFETLRYCDVLHIIFPDVYKLLTAIESSKWHPEGNAYAHTMLVLNQASINELDLAGMFSALVHDIGKGLTKFEMLPRHYGHDVNGEKFLDEFCEKYSVPTDIKKISKYVTRYHMYMHKLKDLNPKTIVHMLDACRCNETYTNALYMVGICDERGRLGSDDASIDHLEIFHEYVEAYKSVKFSDFPNLFGSTDGEKIRSTMEKARINAVAQVKKKHS